MESNRVTFNHVFGNRYIQALIYSHVDQICRSKGGRRISELPLLELTKVSLDGERQKSLFIDRYKELCSLYKADHLYKPSTVPLLSQRDYKNTLSSLVNSGNAVALSFMLGIARKMYLETSPSDAYLDWDKLSDLYVISGSAVVDIVLLEHQVPYNKFGIKKLISHGDFNNIRRVFDPIIEMENSTYMNEWMKEDLEAAMLSRPPKPVYCKLDKGFRLSYFNTALLTFDLDICNYLLGVYKQRWDQWLVKCNQSQEKVVLQKFKADQYLVVIEEMIVGDGKKGKSFKEMMEYLSQFPNHQNNPKWKQDIFYHGILLGRACSKGSLETLQYLHQLYGSVSMKTYTSIVVHLVMALDRDTPDHASFLMDLLAKSPTPGNLSPTKITTINPNIVSIELMDRLAQFSPHLALSIDSIMENFVHPALKYQINSQEGRLETFKSIMLKYPLTPYNSVFHKVVALKRYDYVEFILSNHKKMLVNKRGITNAEFTQGVFVGDDGKRQVKRSKEEAEEFLIKYLDLFDKYVGLAKTTLIDYRELITYSIERGFVGVVKKIGGINSRRISFNPMMVTLAATSNQFEILKYLCEEKGVRECLPNTLQSIPTLEIYQYLYSGDVCKTALEPNQRNAILPHIIENRIDIVKFILETPQFKQGSPVELTESSINPVLHNGYLDMFKVITTTPYIGLPITSRSMDMAASFGQLKMVQWLNDNRTEGASTIAMDYASCNGYLSVLVYLQEQSLRRGEGGVYKVTSTALKESIQNNEVDIVDYLVNQCNMQHYLEGNNLNSRSLFALIESHLNKSQFKRMVPILIQITPAGYLKEMRGVLVEHAVSSGHLWLLKFIQSQSHHDGLFPF